MWQERRAALEDDGAYKEFIKKLQREWAIETGIIERLYSRLDHNFYSVESVADRLAYAQAACGGDAQLEPR